MEASSGQIRQIGTASVAAGGALRRHFPDALLVVGLFAFLPLEHTQAVRHLLAALLAARGAWLLWRRPEWTFLRRCGSILPWALWASLSYFWSVAPAASLSNLKHDLWVPLLAAFGCFQIFRHGASPRLFLAAVTAGTLSNALVTVLGAPAVPWSLELGRYYFSTVGYASTYALCFAALALPWALGEASGRIRPLVLALFLTNVGVALLTQNRMFFVAAALLLLLLPWLAGRLRRRTVQFLLLAAVVLTGIFLVVNQERTEARVSGAGLAEALAHVAGNEVRFEIWRRWLDRAAAGPALGTGFGRDVPPMAMSADEVAALKVVDPFAAMHSHNLLLNVRVELGWAGLAAFIGLLAGMAWQFAAARPRAPLAAASGLLLLAAVLLKNQTDVFLLFGPAVLFYAALGSLAAWLDDPVPSS